MNNFKIWISTCLVCSVLAFFSPGAAEFVHDDLMALYNIPPPNAWLAGNVLTRDKRCSTTCSPLIDNGPPVTDGLVQGTLTQTDDNSNGCSKKTLTCTGLDDDTENAYTSLSVFMQGDSSDTSGLSVYDFIMGSGPIELDVECDDNGSWSVNGMEIGNSVYCESTPVETTTMEPTTIAPSTTTESTTTTTTRPTTTTPRTTTTQSTNSTSSTTTTTAPATTISTTTSTSTTTSASSTTAQTTTVVTTTIPTTESTIITTRTTPSTTTMSTTPSSTTKSTTTTASITTTPSTTTTVQSTTTPSTATSSTMLPTSTTFQQTTPTKSTTKFSTTSPTTMPMTSTLSPSTTSKSTSTSQSSSTRQSTITSSSSTMPSTSAQLTTTNMKSTTASSPTTTSTGSTASSSTITTRVMSTMNIASTAATTVSQGQVTVTTTTSLSPTSTTTPNSNCPSSCPNGTWSSWSAPSACTDTCGACGTQTMTRTCTSEASGCPCQGLSSTTVPCNRTPCKFPRLSCCAPAKTMAYNAAIICGPDNTTDSTSSLCVSNTMPPTTTISTTTKAPCCQGGVWSNWTASNACSDTCGSCGTQTLTRTCSSAVNGCPCSGNSTATVNCNVKPCAYPRNSCCGSYKAMASNGAIICGPQPSQPTNNSTCTAT